MPLTHPDVVRFGSFDLDRCARALYKNGVRQRIQEQPLRVLLRLLEQPGAVVTRDELRRHLWDDDTHVDFERSLNTAVKKLRQSLGDCGANPRYVVTVPRVGYRFIAPVLPSSPEPVANVVAARHSTWAALGGLFAATAIVLIFWSQADVLIRPRTSPATELLVRAKQIFRTQPDPESTRLARELFEQALRLDNSLADAQAWRAASLTTEFGAGNADTHSLREADLISSSVMRTVSDKGPALLARVTLHHTKGEWEKSLSEVRSVIRPADGSPEALEAAGRAFQQASQLHQATGFFERAVQLDPENFNARIALAKNLRFRGDRKGALDVLRTLSIEGHPEELEILNDAEQFERAERLAQRYSAAYRSDPRLWYQWSRALKGLNREKQARKVLVEGFAAGEAQVSRFENFRTRTSLALLSGQVGDRLRLEVESRRARDLAPENPWVDFFVGIAWAIARDNDRAIESLKRAAERGFVSLHYLEYYTRVDTIGSDSIRSHPEFHGIQAKMAANVDRLRRLYGAL